MQDPATPLATGLPADKQAELIAAWSSLDDGLEAEFSGLLSQWDYADAHRKLLQQLSLRGLLRLGGLRYQKANLVRPNDPVIAAAQQVLLNLAMAGMQRAPLEEASAPASPVRYIIGFLLFGLVSLALGRVACGGMDAMQQLNGKPAAKVESDG